MAEIRVGTSGWHYAHWRGPFYPSGLDSAAWLHHYSEHLDTVEINNSFYRLPERSACAVWARETPKDFLFSVKAWRMLTHMKKLKDCGALIERFFEQTKGLGRKHGPVLFQLPPRWRCNPERLEGFLAALPARRRYAFEFRDPSWHTDDVLDLLAQRNAAFCIFELGELRTPEICTADFAYVRLHGSKGPYRGSYAHATLRRWARRIGAWAADGKDVYLYFDNDENAFAVDNALTLTRLIEAV